MVGIEIKPRRTAPVKAVSPVGRSKNFRKKGTITKIPIKPSTTDGMPAKISTTGLRIP
jgi:hypothetical protein